ncbi:nitroreductase [Arcanobacterium haemolyticum]|uniref:Nitroreductase n=1 Tax=Arcanobacterium haemolyticum (strain ATCC 9345 / DSM 20595 / CCM 5947 / CCUG 17215 / LMG 16163 / NBRC 15585 / NCTC 8452 / 11018) TaxID=644284 RepID=D7BPJ9_ARCHD|nr:nitroreductase [Arcanobacterium haemolyticum]ADH92848.1 nitroreductase [Arcanobacterium haemolyticum DSM 20595]SQH28403.1 malonic semialdehyde reductase [Arcanobacterium haemolyticum]
MNDFSQLVSARHTVRDFDSAPVPDDVLAEIFEDARCAPSWSNTRPYRFALASGDTARRLKNAYVREFEAMSRAQAEKVAPDIDGDYDIFARYPDELRARQIEVGVGLYQHLGIARDDRAGRAEQMRRNFEAFGAPVVGLVFIHRDFLPFSAMDAGLVLQTIFLSAQSRGVDSCPLGVLAGWRRPADEVFEVPEDYALVTGFALGYGTDAPINDFRAAHPPVKFLAERA